MPSDLTLAQGQSHALTGLAAHWPEASLRLAVDKTLECEFGWVFTVDVADAAVSDRSGRLFPTLVLVAKTSGQVVATAMPYTAASFAKVYARLLARSRANARAWCLTMTAHHGAGPRHRFDNLAEDARRAGLVELKAGRIE